ncbi:terminase gpA endonuclease subunit [Luteimonas sp. TWI662]|uniref:terminase gpA endonuclease subunit n=1 Tax=Luteimonas sp. TWI662 TaxID=3136789 RepID=UPI003209F800
MLRPPRRIQVADGARALRVNAGTGSGEPWDAATTPYMVKPLNATKSRVHEAVVFMGPARSGKTLALIEGRLAYTITCDPSDVMVIQSTQDAAADFSKTRITRALRGSPELLKQLSPRAHDDNVLMKFFRSGMSLRLGHPSISVLSGKDLKTVLMTDVDNFTGDLGIDEAFGLALKRTQTFMSGGMVVAESSPEADYEDGQWRVNPDRPHEAPPATGIAALYNRGDRHRWYWPCMECGEYFQAAPGYDLFRLPPEHELLERVQVDDMLSMSRRLSIVYCPHCHVGLEDRWKDAMNQRGDWVGEGQVIHPDGSIDGDTIESRTRSYYLGGVAAAFQSWESLVERYLQALKVYAKTGEEKPLKTTYNVDAALNYVPMAARSESNPTAMQDRAETWTNGAVPAGVHFLTATVDGQKNRFVVQVMGWGPGESGNLERWIVDRYSLRTSERPDGAGGFLGLEPAKYLEDWERLVDKVIQRRYPLDDASGRTMPVRAVGIDWGGTKGHAPRALEFWRSLKARGLHWRVRLVKGGGNRDYLWKENTPDSSKRKDRKTGSRGDVPQLLINVDRMKDLVAANVARTEPGPGFYHFADWLPTVFYEELNAETRTSKGWENLGKRRNEEFDLAVYNETLAQWIKAPAINWSNPPAWAAGWDTNPDVVKGDEPPPPPPTPPRTRRPRVVQSKYLRR